MKAIKKQKKAFTLIELIVVITILAILWTIAFIALQGYSSNSRDSVRLSDVSKIKKALELYSIETWAYPMPSNWQVREFDTGGGTLELWKEWTFNNDMYIQVWQLSKKPVDPLDKSTEYVYSKATNLNQYEILVNLEDEKQKFAAVETALADDWYKTQRIEWTYNGYYVKGIDETDPLNKVVLLATPSIITWDVTGPQTVNDWGTIPLKLDWTFTSWDTLTVNKIYSWPTEPKEDEEVYEFTENLKATLIDTNSLGSKPDYNSLNVVWVKWGAETVEDFIASPVWKNTVDFGRAILWTKAWWVPELVGCIYGWSEVPSSNTPRNWYISNDEPTSAQCNATPTNRKEFYCDNWVWKDKIDDSVKDDWVWQYTYCNSDDQCWAVTDHPINDTVWPDTWSVTFDLIATNINTSHAPLTQSDTVNNYTKTFELTAACQNDATWDYSNVNITAACVNEWTWASQNHKVPWEDKCELNQVPITPVPDCTGSVPANATSTSTTSGKSNVYDVWNTSTLVYDSQTPEAWHQSLVADECTFTCDGGYTWHAGTSSCVASNWTWSCWWTAPDWVASVNNSTGWLTTFSQSWDGSTYTPANMDWTYNTTPWECTFECATNYYWDPDANWVWNWACVNWCQIDGPVWLDNCTIK